MFTGIFYVHYTLMYEMFNLKQQTIPELIDGQYNCRVLSTCMNIYVHQSMKIVAVP